MGKKYKIKFKIADKTCEIDKIPVQIIKSFKNNCVIVDDRNKADFCVSYIEKIDAPTILLKSISKTRGEIIVPIKSRIAFRDVKYNLKTLLQFFSLSHDIVLLHGSSVEVGGRAQVFIGPSGAGKSTIARCFPKQRILADDFVVLKKINQEFFVYSSSMDKKKAPSIRPRRLPLGVIYTITKSKKPRILTLLEEKAYEVFTSNSFYYAYIERILEATNNPLLLSLKNRIGIQLKAVFFNYLFNQGKIQGLYFDKSGRLLKKYHLL